MQFIIAGITYVSDHEGLHPYNDQEVAWVSRPDLAEMIREGDLEAIAAGLERIEDHACQQRTVVKLRAALKDAGVARVVLHEANRTWRDQTAADRKAAAAAA